MDRAEIAAVFESIADILQIKGEEPRRVQTYRRIARILDVLQEDIEHLYRTGELAQIPGIGPSSVKKIGELIDTGRCEYYEELRASIPAGVMDLMAISGVGASTAAKLYQEVGIDSLDTLQEALDSQKLRKVKGMGKKTEEKIRAGLESLIRFRLMWLMGKVLPQTQLIADSLSRAEGVSAVSLVGGLRRRTETVRDAQILAACENFVAIRDSLANIEWVESVDEGWTDSGGSAKLAGGMELHIRLVSPENFGPALIRFTGSEGHVAELDDLAKRSGLDALSGKSEEQIYANLGLPFIVPELREAQGEIQAALEGRLPHLIEPSDIRGDLHVHSNWSDGTETIEAMAEAARNLGYEYIAVCDHSVSSRVANGLDIERILNKMIDVREINEKIPGIEILMGGEVDILTDGNLDYPDEILEKLDVVVASIHSGFNMDEARMTKRLISAIENRFVRILGHPTGRLLSRREPYQVNMDAVIDAAVENNTSLEINAYPDRLDLKDIHARQAKERGVMMSINTDAHRATDLHLLIYGIYTARRAWLEKENVLNTLALPELMKWLGGR